MIILTRSIGLCLHYIKKLKEVAYEVAETKSKTD